MLHLTDRNISSCRFFFFHNHVQFQLNNEQWDHAEKICSQSFLSMFNDVNSREYLTTANDIHIKDESNVMKSSIPFDRQIME